MLGAVPSPVTRLSLALLCALALTWALSPIAEEPSANPAAASVGHATPATEVTLAPGPGPLGSSTLVTGTGLNLLQHAAVSNARGDTIPVSRSEVALPARPERASDRWMARHCRAGRIALTFDDGPSKYTTMKLVRFLRRHDIPATFFMVGVRVESAPGVARAVARNRRLFTVANHTWGHPDLRTLSRRDVRRSLRGTSSVLRRHGIEPSNLMRPPYGALDREARDGIRDEGLIPVLWNVDSADWTPGSADAIEHRILSQLRRGKGNIVLQHDGINNSPPSIRAVPAVVRAARARGYCFVPLNENGRAARPLTPRR